MDVYNDYKNICYGILGKYLDEQPINQISSMIYQADMEITAGMFISMAIVTSIVAAVPMLIFSLIFFGISIYTYLLVLVTIAIVGIMFPFVLFNKISSKKTGIEKEIPFALAYMSILASAGSTPLDMLRRMAVENYGDISSEFRKVVYRIDVLGDDEVSAMNDLANNTPSEIFRSIIVDMANIMYSGSGLKQYLELKSRELLDIKRQTQKEFVDSLSVYGEMYMGGILMMVIMTVVGIVLCGALNIDIGPFKPSEIFVIFIYLLLPLIDIIFYLMLEMKYSRSP
jgi:flagellar protein FlaJ